MLSHEQTAACETTGIRFAGLRGILASYFDGDQAVGVNETDSFAASPPEIMFYAQLTGNLKHILPRVEGLSTVEGIVRLTAFVTKQSQPTETQVGEIVGRVAKK